jgi:hypothetical protein
VVWVVVRRTRGGMETAVARLTGSPPASVPRENEAAAPAEANPGPLWIRSRWVKKMLGKNRAMGRPEAHIHGDPDGNPEENQRKTGNRLAP